MISSGWDIPFQLLTCLHIQGEVEVERNSKKRIGTEIIGGTGNSCFVDQLGVKELSLMEATVSYKKGMI